MPIILYFELSLLLQPGKNAAAVQKAIADSKAAVEKFKQNDSHDSANSNSTEGNDPFLSPVLGTPEAAHGESEEGKALEREDEAEPDPDGEATSEETISHDAVIENIYTNSNASPYLPYLLTYHFIQASLVPSSMPSAMPSVVGTSAFPSSSPTLLGSSAVPTSYPTVLGTESQQPNAIDEETDRERPSEDAISDGLTNFPSPQPTTRKYFRSPKPTKVSKFRSPHPTAMPSLSDDTPLDNDVAAVAHANAVAGAANEGTLKGGVGQDDDDDGGDDAVDEKTGRGELKRSEISKRDAVIGGVAGGVVGGLTSVLGSDQDGVKSMTEIDKEVKYARQ